MIEIGVFPLDTGEVDTREELWQVVNELGTQVFN